MKVEEAQETSSTIDFGLLSIYTCSASCKPKSGKHYAKEFLWRQDLSNSAAEQPLSFAQKKPGEQNEEEEGDFEPSKIEEIND